MSLVNALWLSSYLTSGKDTTDPKPDPEPLEFEPFNDSRDDHDWLKGILDSPRPTTGSQPVKLPALFATSLPPAGYEIQLAFQNVVHRLRYLYIHPASVEADAACPTDLTLRACEIICNHLTNEKIPSNGPWRRQGVLLMERKWASWFVKEAQLGTRWAGMIEREKKLQRIMWEGFVVPVELKLGFCEEREKGWGAWREERRADLVGEEWAEVGGNG